MINRFSIIKDLSGYKTAACAPYYASFSLKKSTVRFHANSAAALSYRGVVSL